MPQSVANAVKSRLEYKISLPDQTWADSLVSAHVHVMLQIVAFKVDELCVIFNRNRQGSSSQGMTAEF